ncbi:MAG TPA: GNAT family N-acetyltransferase [Lachnospiraceae bacterium]|nr:GNAT family N-acetyltransferase [Lachnospiraceae bacterium]HEX3076176.1 GNAT family N-acetyltransferase [Lachnospiraceae bacterium]
MIYYQDDLVTIRDMRQSDCLIIHNEITAQNWNSELSRYEKYYNEQNSNERYVFIAEYRGNIAGYTTLIPVAMEGPFAPSRQLKDYMTSSETNTQPLRGKTSIANEVSQGIPEVVDFNVFIKYQRLGIGNRILDVAEAKAAEFSNIVSLGVGLHSGYGSAQRIYVKRGYLPDGSGVWYQNKQLGQYEQCNNDDELILYFSKVLNNK